MATNTGPVDEALARDGIEPTPEQQPIPTASYQVIGDSKIPVSKKHGTVWKHRRDAAANMRKGVEGAWDEALRYFNNDQLGHRYARNEAAGNITRSRRDPADDSWSETENVVYANVTTMLDVLYARNPTVEITPRRKDDQDAVAFARIIETLVNNLMDMEVAPGVRLKPKARRGVLQALLTNVAWMKIEWVQKNESAEQALLDIQKVSEELQAATDPKVIEELEGKLMAIENHLDVLSASGPKLKLVPGKCILFDPSACEMDMSDANWMMEEDLLPTEYIRARYMFKDGEEYKSLYEPTHVLKVGKTGESATEDEVNNFELFSKDEHDKYGYKDKDSFNSAKFTKVWYVWDRVTRRVFMYHDKDWSWPLWVWDDPLKLPRFFPYRNLWFHDNPEGGYGKGEVTYYLDQQDAINNINSEMKKVRDWAFYRFAYNLNKINKDEVAKLLSGDEKGVGIDVPEGQSLKDILEPITPPSVKVPELFDKGDKYQAIERLSSVGTVLRGEQFKTNTTNQAIASYQQAQQIRIDGKTDAIEDWIGGIAWDIACLCAMHMDAATVSSIIGMSVGGLWRNIQPDELKMLFNMQVVGGSTQKPTSIAKKQEALEVGQILGQFGATNPVMPILILKMFQQAFDGVVITEQDWQMLLQVTQQMLMGPPPGEEGGGGEEEGEGGDVPDPNSPEGQQIQALIDQGMPPEQAMQQVLGGGTA